MLYEAYRDRPDCPDRALFLEAMRRNELVYMMRQEEVMGVACRRAGSIHVGVLPAWRGRCATRGLIRDVLAWAAEKGKLWTLSVEGDARSARLITGVGFVKKNGGRFELQNS